MEDSFSPPLSDEGLHAAFDALKPCLEVRSVRRLPSWLADDRRSMICEFHAADAQAVRDAYHAAQVRYAKVWPAQLFEFGPPQAPEN